ncbi:hypothetical protein [Rhizobium sp.]|uniref:hypothetical protein n=1 Tax=Rhizobium sp. TaxID=391 RepID=UPI00289EB2F3
MPRALFMTNQFFSFAGAELTVLELAEEFASRGWECIIKAAVVGMPLSYRAFSAKIEVSALLEDIVVDDFDFVWCQHGTIANVDFQSLSGKSHRPFLVSAHLSPYLALEKILHPYTGELADLIVANSKETAKALPSWLNSEIIVSGNPAPRYFFRQREYRKDIERILCVSNHLPGELAHVLLHFERNLNINVTHIGVGSEGRRVKPEDIIAADVVITIGKSVQYALASRTPVYLYDHFGGDGWLTPENISDQAAFNFSGRPDNRKLTSDDILKELSADYSDVARITASLTDSDIAKFHLSLFVDNLIERITTPRPPLNYSEFDERGMDVANLQIKLHQATLRQKYGLTTSDMWSKPSLDSYFGGR